MPSPCGWLAEVFVRDPLLWGDGRPWLLHHRESGEVRDLQATILHQIGIDPHRFSFPYQGLPNQRLIGPTEEGRVLTEILGQISICPNAFICSNP